MKKKLEGTLKLKKGWPLHSKDEGTYIDFVIENWKGEDSFRVYSNSLLEKLLETKVKLTIKAESSYKIFWDFFTGKRKLKVEIAEENKYYNIKFGKENYGKAYQQISFSFTK